MPLPDALTLTTLSGTYTAPDGTPLGGQLTFTPSSALTNESGHPVLAATPLTVRLAPGTGSFSISLLNTDNDGLLPDTWMWRVIVAVPGAQESYFFGLPATLGDATDINALTPVAPPPTGATFVASVNGQTGDVVLADGFGILPPAGDLGAGTTLAPQVTATHLSAPLPVVQGGTGAASGTAALTALGAASAAGLAAEISRAETAEASLATSAAITAETSRAEAAEALKAPLASPAFTGTPTAPTQTTGDASTKVATDAFVATAVAAEATRATTAEGLAVQRTVANTFTADQYFESGRPWLDVIAFGADPTGTADSTLAIQTAINTALGLRTDTGVSMSGFTVTDPAAVSGDVGLYVNSPNYPAIVSYTVGVTASNPTMQITGVSAAPFVVNQPVILTAATAPAGFTAGTTYFVLSPSLVSTTFSFSLSATSGGGAITPTTTGTTVAVAPPTGGCSLITAVTPGTGYTVATPAPASLSGQVVAVGAGSSFVGRSAKWPVFIPGGTYKITSDILIQSAFGFRLTTGGHNLATLRASGGNFTTAILNIDGSTDGYYGGLQIRGDGTEGTGGVASSGIPAALNLTWTTSAKQSTTASTLEHFRIRNLKFVTGVSLAGVGTRQLDGTQLRDIVVAGGQPLGGWSSAARTDTNLCGTTSGSPTVTDTAAVTGDFGKFISGPGIPAGATITAVSAGTGYTISANATANASANTVTFTVGTGLWQAGFQFGNGAQGNIYDQAMYGCTASGCFVGYNCNLSSFALFSGQPAVNGTDFVIEAGAQCTIENVQSQNSRQFFTAVSSGSVFPISFRDCSYTGYTGTGFSATWISVDTLFGSLLLENMSHTGAIPSPVIALGSANYHAQFTLINISQKSPPSTGITVTGGAAVVAVNYSDTTSGVGTSAVLYPFYAINAGVLFQQGTAAARPAASAFGEMFYWATDTSALSHSSGSAWTALTGGGSVTAPDIQVFTSSDTWTKPSSPAPVTTEVLLIAPGGGGASGRQGAASTIRCGGGGGAGGQVLRKVFKTADLTSTVSVTVPGQASGGAAQATADSNGLNGTTPGNTTFGAFCSAVAGSAGQGGTAVSGFAGTMFLGLSTLAGSGAAASITGLAGISGNPAGLTAPGGPSGGGITAANAAGAGAGGMVSAFGAATGAGAAGVVDTTAPTSGAGTTVNGSVGASSGSGAASITTAAQAGADAAATAYGVGGAGGGASLDPNASGAGGKGGPGFAMVISYYQ